MAFGFPIQQVPQFDKLTRTEIIFDERQIDSSLLKNHESTFDYVVDAYRKNKWENPKDIYMKRKLGELQGELEKETALTSSITEILDNRSFKAIVAMGYDVVPLILEELKYGGSYLVWAMNLITKSKISDQKISLSEAAKLWVNWGLRNKP